MNNFWDAIGLPRPSRRPPALGMRAFKTAIVICLIFGVYAWIGRDSTGAFLAGVAAAVSMQDTVGHSVRAGAVRLLANGLGGVVGIVLIVLMALLSFPREIMRIAALFLGTMLTIFVCVWLNLKEAVIIALVVMMAILLNTQELAGSLQYALNRILDTVIGIVISVLVNLTIKPPKT